MPGLALAIGLPATAPRIISYLIANEMIIPHLISFLPFLYDLFRIHLPHSSLSREHMNT